MPMAIIPKKLGIKHDPPRLLFYYQKLSSSNLGNGSSSSSNEITRASYDGNSNASLKLRCLKVQFDSYLNEKEITTEDDLKKVISDIEDALISDYGMYFEKVSKVALRSLIEKLGEHVFTKVKQYCNLPSELYRASEGNTESVEDYRSIGDKSPEVDIESKSRPVYNYAAELGSSPDSQVNENALSSDMHRKVQEASEVVNDAIENMNKSNHMEKEVIRNHLEEEQPHEYKGKDNQFNNYDNMNQSVEDLDRFDDNTVEEALYYSHEEKQWDNIEEARLPITQEDEEIRSIHESAVDFDEDYEFDADKNGNEVNMEYIENSHPNTQVIQNHELNDHLVERNSYHSEEGNLDDLENETASNPQTEEEDELIDEHIKEERMSSRPNYENESVDYNIERNSLQSNIDSVANEVANITSMNTEIEASEVALQNTYFDSTQDESMLTEKRQLEPEHGEILQDSRDIYDVDLEANQVYDFENLPKRTEEYNKIDNTNEKNPKVNIDNESTFKDEYYQSDDLNAEKHNQDISFEDKLETKHFSYNSNDDNFEVKTDEDDVKTNYLKYEFEDGNNFSDDLQVHHKEDVYSSLSDSEHEIPYEEPEYQSEYDMSSNGDTYNNSIAHSYKEPKTENQSVPDYKEEIDNETSFHTAFNNGDISHVIPEQDNTNTSQTSNTNVQEESSVHLTVDKNFVSNEEDKMQLFTSNLGNLDDSVGSDNVNNSVNIENRNKDLELSTSFYDSESLHHDKESSLPDKDVIQFNEYQDSSFNEGQTESQTMKEEPHYENFKESSESMTNERLDVPDSEHHHNQCSEAELPQDKSSENEGAYESTDFGLEREFLNSNDIDDFDKISSNLLEDMYNIPDEFATVEFEDDNDSYETDEDYDISDPEFDPEFEADLSERIQSKSFEELDNLNFKKDSKVVNNLKEANIVDIASNEELENKTPEDSNAENFIQSEIHQDTFEKISNLDSDDNESNSSEGVNDAILPQIQNDSENIDTYLSSDVPAVEQETDIQNSIAHDAFDYDIKEEFNVDFDIDEENLNLDEEQLDNEITSNILPSSKNGSNDLVSKDLIAEASADMYKDLYDSEVIEDYQVSFQEEFDFENEDFQASLNDILPDAYDFNIDDDDYGSEAEAPLNSIDDASQVKYQNDQPVTIDAKTLTTIDLNKVDEEHLEKAKMLMDIDFELNRLRPGDEGYQHDVQVDFGEAVEDCDWDSD